MAQEDFLRKEILGVQKKKGTESRLFVLFKDRLDYFSADADEKSEPRGRLTLSDVDKMEVQEDGFTLILGSGQSLVLKTPAESLQPWLSSLKPLLKASNSGDKLKAAKVLCSGYLSVERKGQVKTPFFVLRQDSLERYETAADFEKGQEPRAMPLTDISRMTVRDSTLTMEVRDQKKPLEFQVDSTKANEFAQWARAFEKLLSKRLGANFVSGVDTGEGKEPAAPDSGHASASVSGGTTPRDAPRILCEGDLLVIKKNKEESRYCVLRTDCFEYFSNKEDYQTGAAARARALKDDITDFDVLDDGVMEVRLDDKKLHFKATSPEDLQRWRTAWETDPDDPPEAQAPPQATKAPPQAPSVSLEPKGRVVSSGRFALREAGVEEANASSGKLVLRQDRLEFFKGSNEAMSEDTKPDMSTSIEDIEDLEVRSDRFVVHISGRASRTIELLSPEDKSMEEWYSELQHVFEETESTAAESKGTPDSPDEELLKVVAKDLLQAVKTVNAMLKTERTLRGHKVQSAEHLLKALDEANSGEVRPDDFVGALNGLGIGLTDEQTECLALAIDLSETGGITLPELEKVLQLSEEDSMAVAAKVHQKRSDKIQEPIPTPPLAAVRFADLDKDQDGVISQAEFEQFRQEMIDQAAKPSRSLPGETEENPEDDRPSSPSRPARNRALCSGPVELDGEKRHGVLYADRLAFFATSEDVVYADPSACVQLREMQTVKVNSQGLFQIQALSGVLKMKCRQAFDSWKSSLSEALEPTFTKQVAGQTVEWTNIREANDSPVRLPKPGGAKPMHQGPLKIVQEDGSEQMRYFLVYNDRFEHFTDAAKALRGSTSNFSRGVVYAMDVTSVRVNENAFLFQLRQASLHVQVPIGEDMELWVSAFQLLFHPQNDAGHTPSNVDGFPVLHKRSPFMKDPVQGADRRKIDSTELAAEVQGERFQHWLQTLPEKVVHWGLLGFQHQQRLVVRLSILFKDRLDSWCSASNASSGVKEDSRILMSSIRGLETISGGLILNLGGKKVGVHVGDNENLHQWSRALLSVLAPHKAERSVSPREPEARSRSQTPTPRSTPRKGRDWVPEVAFKSTKSAQAGGKAGGRAGQPRMTVLHRGVSLESVTHLQKAHQPEKRFTVHTHKAGTEAVVTLHGKWGKFLPASHHVGITHVHSEIASKPYSRSESTSAISTRSTSREESLSFKVTGEDRQISPRRRADHSFAFWKINTEEAAVVTANPRSRTPTPTASQGGGSRSRSRTPPDEATLTGKIGSDNYQSLRSRGGLSNEHGVSGKVGGADRKPLQTPRRAKSQSPLVGKVTDAGREQNGWHVQRVSLADKVKSMAQLASASARS